jgi:hypothetical protein
MGLDMDVCYGLKVHKDVWIAKNHQIKGKWMYPHRWTRKVEDAEKFSSAEAAQEYADKHLLSGCKPAVIPQTHFPTDPMGGTPVAVAA